MRDLKDLKDLKSYLIYIVVPFFLVLQIGEIILPKKLSLGDEDNHSLQIRVKFRGPVQFGGVGSPPIYCTI